MIVCSKCGFQNEDSDAFCGSCASFLEWEGQRVSASEPEPQPAAAPEPEPETHVGIIDRVKEAIGIGDAPATGTDPDGQVEPPVGAEAEPSAAEEPEPATPGAVSAPVAGGGAFGLAGAGPAPASSPAPEPVTAAPSASSGTDVMVREAETAVVTAPAASAPVSAGASTPDGPGSTTTVPAPATPAAPTPLATPPASPAAAPPAAPAPAAPPLASPSAVGTVPAPAQARTPTPGTVPVSPAPGQAPTPSAAPPAAARPGLSAVGGQQRTTSPVSPAPPVKPTPPATAAPVGHAARAEESATGPVAPSAVQPQAVKPGAAKARPVAKKAPSERVINPGDKVCGQCGEGNDPVRKFCRRCGASLVEAAVFKLPWYKALWRRFRQRKYKQAGHRPKMRRRAFGGHGGWVSSWATRIVALAVVVFVVLSFLGPWHNSLKSHESRYYHDVIGFVHPTYNPYFAHDAVASSQAPGHPAMYLIDGEHNTSWQSNGKTTGQSIVVHFTGTADIAKVGFDIGDQDTPQSFQTEPRPALVKLEFTGAHPVTRTLLLRDITGFQTYTVDTKASTGLKIMIEKVYPATGNGQNVSIAQLEFFTKS